MDGGLIDLLAGSGFNAITLSVETYNQRFNKKVDFSRMPHEKIRELVSAVRRRGMKTEVYVMYAYPTETLDELYYDERRAEDLGADTLTFHTCTIFPGTEYYRRYVEEGLGEGCYREASRKGHTFYNLVEGFNFTDIPDKELKEFRMRHRLDFE